MRSVAVAAIILFVAWCAGLALAGDPKLDAELADAAYRVAPPATTTTVPAGVGESQDLTAPGIPLPADPVVVVAHPVRGQRWQVTPTEPPPPPVLQIPHYDAWQALARCESGGDWQINTGNGYYGGLQFSLTSWRGAGGQQYASRPDLASPAEQMLTAERLYQMQGWRAWPSCSTKVGLR
jgi:hypothetical protein